MTAPRIVCVEGGHGSGKSTLALALSRSGLGVHYYPTPPAQGATPWEAATHYATERANALRVEAARGTRVLIVPRWHWSTRVLASALDSLGRSDEARALAALHAAERGAIGDPLLTLVCDAPEDVCRARVEARGEVWGAQESAERAEVLRLARIRSWPVLDTTRPRDVVLAEALGIVRGVL